VTYYVTPNLRDFAIGRFPTFIWESDELAYGFPVYGEVATKIGLDAASPVVDPDQRDYIPDKAREDRAERWLAASFSTHCPAIRKSRCASARGTATSSPR